MLLRNGEQLLPDGRHPDPAAGALQLRRHRGHPARKAVDFLAPGVLALAVMSTAFTGQAIATGFERRYGVLKRLASSPLPRWGLMTAKTASVLVTEILQVVLLTVIAFALGWSPHGNPAAVVAVLVVGTAAFSGLGLLMAGTLKAEATLAAANLVFLLLRGRGHRAAGEVRLAGERVLGLLPISALSDGLAGRAPARRRHALGRPGDPRCLGGGGPGRGREVLPLGGAARPAGGAARAPPW